MWLHFLAVPSNTGNRLKRVAQANVISSIVRDKRYAECEVVVLSDFNDYDGETESKDHIDSTPITNVLNIVREINPAIPEDDLINVAQFLPKPERYTAFWD